MKYVSALSREFIFIPSPSYIKLTEIGRRLAKELVPKSVRPLIRLVLYKWVHPKLSPTGFSHPDPKVKG